MKKKYSLRVQLIVFLLIFVVAVLGFVYLFQTSFLDSFYIRNKINTLQSVTSEVSRYIGLDGMDGILDQVGMSNEVCVRVVSNNENYSYVGACSLRNLDNMTVNKIAGETIEAGNEKLFDDFRFKRPFASDPEKIYIYTRMMNINNELVMIMTSTSITPLNATISTLKSQYVIIALTVIAMSILLALLISRFILKPIKQINNESFNLSKGTYDGSHIKTSSQEFDQLNNTLISANEDILKADKAKKELLGIARRVIAESKEYVDTERNIHIQYCKPLECSHINLEDYNGFRVMALQFHNVELCQKLPQEIYDRCVSIKEQKYKDNQGERDENWLFIEIPWGHSFGNDLPKTTNYFDKIFIVKRKPSKNKEIYAPKLLNLSPTKGQH